MKLLAFTLATLLATSAYAVETKTSTPLTQQETPKGIYYGKILEIKDAMGYKYLKVDENGTQLWVAIANAPVNVGETIGYDKKTIMKDFNSKTLKRKFESVIFASDVYLPNKAKAPATLKETLGLVDEEAHNPHQKRGKGAMVEPDETPAPPFVKKETYTIEEINQWRKSLAGQTISLEATVYKVSRGIMKLDWVHLGDGSGEEKKLTDDLVFTTDSTSIKAGDRVFAKGKVIVDKDFGFGYFYKVIIQEASFSPKESK